MALNPLKLGDALRDAVDGPADGLDDLVGEDPVNVDLPALSARIRHRRRARAATRSTLGVAAAGAVVLVGVHGGLGSGALTYRDGAVGPLGPGDVQLCGQDVATMPTAEGVQLIPATVPVVSDGSGDVGTAGDATTLGTLVGRTLAATLVQQDGATTTVGTVVLTRGSAVVAVGTALPQTGGVVAVQNATDGTLDAFSPVEADLAPCPGTGGSDGGDESGGTPGTVPSGTYTVQYLTSSLPPSGSPTLQRSAAGPWLVTLLDAPPPVTLPDGFPADEVPVVSGALLSAAPQDDTGWTVQVAVDGDDALTRAVAALRHADAVVSQSSLSLSLAPSAGQYPTRGGAESRTGSGDPQARLAELQAELTQLQSRRDAASDEVAQGQRAYDELVAAGAQPDSLSWAARQLQTTKDGLATLDSTIEATQLEIATQSMLVDLGATTAGQQAQLDETLASAAAAASRTESYTVAVPTSFTATTHNWSVDVARSAQDGRTVLTYTLGKR